MFFNTTKTHLESPRFVKTRTAVFIYELLNSPLSSMCLLSGFILYKSLAASSFHVAILTMLKPSVSLLILYWSYAIHSKRGKLMTNLVWAGILARIPFFVFPWLHSPSLFIFCMAMYIFFHRAGSPAWLEIMKMNLPSSQRGKIYSFATALAYAEGFLLSFWVGPWMENNEFAWRWIYPLAAAVGLLSIWVQKKLPLYIIEEESEPETVNWKEKVISPWREAINLLKQRHDFRRFQLGFFLGGFGLMMAIAVIPVYFVDTLNISYKELATAILVCQGFGYVLTARVWGHQLGQVHIFKLMGSVTFFFGLFGFFILMTRVNTNCLYIAYFIYGVAQAGSRLCWNLSGPIFSGEENSTAYSSLNILMVGIRGCIAPLMGYYFCAKYGPMVVLIAFITLSLWAMSIMLRGLKSSKSMA